MKNINAIETTYKGYRFRSRLEARWAVFFDSLGLEWEYEKEGFILPDGRYLPDFWISTVGMWAEIKPDMSFDSKAKTLCSQLSIHTDKEVLLLGGVPENKTYNAIQPDGGLCEYVLTNYHDYPRDEHRFYSFPSDYERFEDTQMACDAAKSARFEHGEKPRWI